MVLRRKVFYIHVQAGDALPMACNSKENIDAESSKKHPGSNSSQQELGVGGSDLERSVLGYKAQCEPVVHKLDVLISGASLG